MAQFMLIHLVLLFNDNEVGNMQIEINIGKNSKGYFFSQDGKIILESLSINEVLCVVPYLEECGLRLLGTGLSRELPIDISNDLSFDEISDADYATFH
jgi:hypothetical protein